MHQHRRQLEVVVLGNYNEAEGLRFFVVSFGVKFRFNWLMFLAELYTLNWFMFLTEPRSLNWPITPIDIIGVLMREAH